jgi:hypothetical protein
MKLIVPIESAPRKGRKIWYTSDLLKAIVTICGTKAKAIKHARKLIKKEKGGNHCISVGWFWKGQDASYAIGKGFEIINNN